MPTSSKRTLSFWAYWITTGLLALSQAAAGTLYLVAEAPAETFASLGFGDAFRVLLGTAKLIGAGLLVAPVARFLKEWAYFGFGLTFSLAMLAHTIAGDPARSLLAPGISFAVLLLSYGLFRARQGDAQQAASTSTLSRSILSRLLWTVVGGVGLLLTAAAGRLLYVIYGTGGTLALSLYAADSTWITGFVAVVVLSTVGLPSLYHVIRRAGATPSSPTLLQHVLPGLLALTMAALGIAALIIATGHPLIETVIGLGVPPYMLVVIGTAKLAGAAGLIIPLPRPMKEWTYFGTLATTVAAVVLSAAAGPPVQDVLVPLGVLGLWGAAYRAQPARRGVWSTAESSTASS